MRGFGSVCRLRLSSVAQSVLFLPAAYPDSICAHATADHSGWTRHPGGDAVLRGRRGPAVSQHTERDPILRTAVVRRHGHHDDRDPYRVAALPPPPCLRIPRGRVSAVGRILYRAGRCVADRYLRLL